MIITRFQLEMLIIRENGEKHIFLLCVLWGKTKIQN